ncbi:MAG: hypothetical protein RLZ25_1497, partial [Pseudomonadota bacterium]
IYHLDHAWLPGGFAGVDVFFVISGFVVTGAMEGRGQDRFWGFIADFYARRLARIIPALVLTLVVTTLLDVLFIPESWLSSLDVTLGLSAFFGLSNWVLQKGQETYFTPRVDFNPYLHTWSLGVEEQFYLLAPLLLFFALKPARSVWRLGGVSILFVLALTSLGMSIDATSQMPPWAFYSIFTRFFELASGVLLYLLTRGKNAGKVHVFPRLGAAIGLTLVLAAFGWADDSRMPWPFSVLPVGGALLLIGSVSTKAKDPVRRVLSASPLVWLGRQSYALYLWHWPVDVVFRWTLGLDSLIHRGLAVLLALLLAASSTSWIEQPLRHAKFLERRPRLIRILFFLSLILAGAWLSSTLFDHRSKFSLSQVSRHQYDWYVLDRMRSSALGLGQCRVEMQKLPLSFGALRRYAPRDCQHGKSPRTLFVIGDSHALMLLAMLDQASAELGLRINVISLEGCPYFDFRTLFSTRELHCREHFAPLRRYLLEEGRPGDLILMASLMLTRYADQNERYPIPDMKAYLYGSGYQATIREVLDEVKETIQIYREHGLGVILWAPPPLFKAPTFRCMDWFNRHNPICEGGAEMPKEELESLRGPILNEMKKIAGPDISIFDAFSRLCPDAMCRAVAPNGRPLFFDGDHMSRYGNELIYPDFRALLEQLGVRPEPNQPGTP